MRVGVPTEVCAGVRMQAGGQDEARQVRAARHAPSAGGRLVVGPAALEAQKGADAEELPEVEAVWVPERREWRREFARGRSRPVWPPRVHG